jgi:hypothetical protein
VQGRSFSHGRFSLSIETAALSKRLTEGGSAGIDLFAMSSQRKSLSAETEMRSRRMVTSLQIGIADLSEIATI